MNNRGRPGEVIKIGRPISQQPVPADFRRYAGCEGDLKLRERYHVGRAVILRWREATGVYCGAARGKRMPSRPGHAKPAAYRSTRKPRYNPAAMDEISWYDGQDDIDTLLLSVGICVGFGE